MYKVQVGSSGSKHSLLVKHTAIGALRPHIIKMNRVLEVTLFVPGSSRLMLLTGSI